MESPIPIKPELQGKETTVRMLVLIHSLLADGLFAGKFSAKLTEARSFVEVIHNEALKALEADKDYQEKIKKEKEDGREAKEGTPPQVPPA
jgi:hypothetical protein